MYTTSQVIHLAKVTVLISSIRFAFFIWQCPIRKLVEFQHPNFYTGTGGIHDSGEIYRVPDIHWSGILYKFHYIYYFTC